METPMSDSRTLGARRTELVSIIAHVMGIADGHGETHDRKRLHRLREALLDPHANDRDVIEWAARDATGPRDTGLRSVHVFPDDEWVRVDSNRRIRLGLDRFFELVRLPDMGDERSGPKQVEPSPARQRRRELAALVGYLIGLLDAHEEQELAESLGPLRERLVSFERDDQDALDAARSFLIRYERIEQGLDSIKLWKTNPQLTDDNNRRLAATINAIRDRLGGA